MDRARVKALGIAVMLIWLVTGFLLTPVVWEYLSWYDLAFWKYLSLHPLVFHIKEYAFLMIISALIVGVIFAGKVKGVFNKAIASFFLVFHSFPSIAYLVGWMWFPTGILIFLVSPWNPLRGFPPTRRLVEIAVRITDLPPILVFTLLFLGCCLFLLGLSLFTVALIQFLRKKGLVTSGLYSVTRHPQYLGIILTILGLTILQVNITSMSLIAWTMLVFAYVWLARREESNLQERYGEEFLAYKGRVPFILPLPTRTRELRRTV